MQAHVWRDEYSGRLAKFNCYPIGDVHWGAKGCDEEGIAKTIRIAAEDPMGRVLLMGDLGDYIAKNDPRFNADELADWITVSNISKIPDVQVDFITEQLEPVKNKIIGAVRGNHEEKVLKFYNTDVHARVCHNLGIKDLGYSALIRWSLTRNTKRGSVIIYAHHGHGGGRKAGAKVNRLHDTGGDFEADVYLFGHVHERGWSSKPIIYLNATGEKVLSRERHYGLTGTYLKTYEQGSTGYGEVKGYPPTSLGGISFSVYPEDMQIETHNGPVHIRKEAA